MFKTIFGVFKVLGSLPPSNSPRFSLNLIDWKNLLRLLLVQAVALALTLAPTLAGVRYVFHGVDYTAPVLVGLNLLVAAARRFVAGQPKASP